jgi:putative membrane protein
MEVAMGWNFPGQLMPFGPVVVIVVIFACAVMATYMMRGRQSGNSVAVDILRERFARGEIDKAEYEERRRLLDA